MKKNVLILISVLFIGTGANAQYRINKTKYDYRTYSYQVGDPYNPSVAGLTSLLIPGLGQMLSGEGGRGFGFLGGYVGCMVVYLVGFGSAYNDNGGTGSGGAGIMVLGALGAIGVDIWSIIDAVHVAKVNDLAFRDKSKTSYNIQVQPYINISNCNYNSKIPVGLSLKVRF